MHEALACCLHQLDASCAPLGCVDFFFLFPHVREGFNKLQNHKFHLGRGGKNSNFFVLHGDSIICINIACLLADRVIKKWPALLLFGHTPYSCIKLVSFIFSFTFFAKQFLVLWVPCFCGTQRWAVPRGALLCLQSYFTQISEYVPNSLFLKKARHHCTQASMLLAAHAKCEEHM